jgi:hypothetical protein
MPPVTFFHVDYGLSQFNVLWLVPDEIESFPDGLINALDERSGTSLLSRVGSDHRGNHGIESRLRRQMRADALQPLPSEPEDAPSRQTPGPYPPELIDEALQFLRLNVTVPFAFFVPHH